MSALDIIIALHALLYVPALVAGCWISFRLGIARGRRLGHDEASQLWPQHSDYDGRLR